MHIQQNRHSCAFHKGSIGLAGVVHAAMGQSQSSSSEHLRLAQQCFQAVGSSAAECDTIPGWPCLHLLQNRLI